MKDDTAGMPTQAWRRRRRRLAFAILLAVWTLALGAGAAEALVVNSGEHAVSYEPVRGAGAGGAHPNARRQARALSKQPLIYNGGRVMPSSTNYAIYWDPSGGAAFPAGYETKLNRYFEDVAHDSGGAAEHRLRAHPVRG